jgi:hypothetical protein
VQFHHEPEQVHRRIQTEYHDGAGKIVYARQLSNDDDHHGRTQGIFVPSDVVDATLEICFVPFEHATGEKLNPSYLVQQFDY